MNAAQQPIVDLTRLSLGGGALFASISFAVSNSYLCCFANDPSAVLFSLSALFAALCVFFRVGGAVFAGPLDALLRKSAMCVVCAAGMVLGEMIVCAGSVGLTGLDGPPIIMGAVLFAFGSVFFQAIWVDQLSFLERRPAMLAVSTAFVIAELLSFAADAMSPVTRIAYCVCLSIISGLALASGARAKSVGACLSVAGRRFDCRQRLMLFAVVVGIFVYGLASQLVRVSRWTYVSVDVAQNMASFHMLGILIIAAFFCVCLIISETVGGDRYFDGFVRVFVPIALALGILLPALFLGIPIEFAKVITGIGIGCFEISIYWYATAICRATNLSSLKTIGLSFAAMDAAALVGQCLSVCIEGSFAEQVLESSQVSLVIVFFLMVVSMCVFYPFSRNRGEFIGAIGSEGAEAVQSVSQGACGKPSDKADTDESMEAVELAIGDFKTGEPADSSPDAQSFEMDELACESDVPEREALRKRYRLTARECEVAVLLLKGRSLPYIQNELCISRGTANTHVRHVYEKTGVHSKQELIDLFE